MAYFVANRSFTLRTTRGHTIGFEKGVPTHVPTIIEPDAVEAGCVPVKDAPKAASAATVSDTVTVAKRKPGRPRKTDASQRTDK